MSKFRVILETVCELFQFLWRQKLWWMIPLIVLLLAFMGLIILGGSSGVGPFMYTLF